MKRHYPNKAKALKKTLTCKKTGKKCYEVEEDADEAVEALKVTRKRKNKTLASYPCEWCDSWHVGHSFWREH